MVTGGTLTSAAGVLALLDDPEEDVKVFALSKLNELVDNFWPEISEFVSKIEMLYEKSTFPDKELSALVASKVYYHLGSFQESLMFALKAGHRFDVNSSSEYTETIVSKCIDHYTMLRVKQFDQDPDATALIDPHLEAVVDRMFEWCFERGCYKQAAGVAFETRRLDIIQRAIIESGKVADMLAYCLKITLSVLNNRRFRNLVLEVLVRQYSQLASPDFISICQCYIFLDDAPSTAAVLERLARGSQVDCLTAYQISFDLYESATQHFLSRLQDSISAVLPVKMAVVQPQAETVGSNPEEEQEKGNSSESQAEQTATEQKEEDDVPERMPDKEEEPMEIDRADPDVTGSKKDTSNHGNPFPEESEEEEWVTRLRQVKEILRGEKTVSLHQEFLIRSNHTDLQILKNTKETGRNSIAHNATVAANGLMHYGTTSDRFLRENLDWLKRASNWAKFTATGSLGVIHYGHEKEALNLMSSYLPKDSSGSPYAEGGGLYALGLIHANHGQNIVDYISQELRSNQNEVIRHGGCLGLGLAAMGTADQDVYGLLKDNLCQDDAVVGEAAGIAMGLVMLGTKAAQAITDMTEYASDTQHEKIQRGLALGIAMLFYGQLEEADPWILTLCHHKDPLLRRAGMFTISMAYCGTSDNKAVRKLLHFAVSDVDDDVRRAAVLGLGFILFRTPEQCPNVVSLLSESFNPHVRCGAAWALGIACAASGNKDALAIIEPMLSDAVPFVQQAALIASAMILIQHTESMNSRVASFRQRYSKMISDKLEDSVAKFGAIIAQGIIDAGGRNVTISLQSRTGHTSVRTVVGILVFSQFWFWFPLCHFLSLSFTPTAIIGLNSKLQLPKIEVCSNAKPSLYGYPPLLEKEKGREKEKVATAVLSVAKKAKAKQKRLLSVAGADEKKGEGEEKGNPSSSPAKSEPMEVESNSEPKPEVLKASAPGPAPLIEPTPVGSGSEDKSTEGKPPPPPASEEKKPEPSFEVLSCPSRVLPQQLKVLIMESGSRYRPLKPITCGGIIMFLDTQSDQPEELIEPVKVTLPGQDDEEDEPLPPEPFEFTDDI